MRKFLFILLSFLVIGGLLPLVVRAVDVPSLFPAGYWGTDPPLLPCKGGYTKDQGQPNPNACKDVCQLVALTRNVIYLGMSFAVFAIAPILFLWGGILILIAGANPGLLDQGKKVLTGTVIGMLIAILAFLIIKFFIQTVGVQQGIIQGFGDDIVCVAPISCPPGQTYQRAVGPNNTVVYRCSSSASGSF